MVKPLSVDNLKLDGRGFSPVSPDERKPIKLTMRAHGLTGDNQPEVVVTVIEAQTKRKFSEAESGVWLTTKQATELHGWLGEFLAAAKGKAARELK